MTSLNVFCAAERHRSAAAAALSDKELSGTSIAAAVSFSVWLAGARRPTVPDLG
jgi:hypothetical protein